MTSFDQIGLKTHSMVQTLAMNNFAWYCGNWELNYTTSPGLDFWPSAKTVKLGNHGGECPKRRSVPGWSYCDFLRLFAAEMSNVHAYIAYHGIVF